MSEEANAELSRILMNGANDPRDSEVGFFNDAVDILRQVVLEKEYSALLVQADKYKLSDNETYRENVQKSLEVKRQLDKLKII